MSLSELLRNNHNDLTDHDLAHLADWATNWKDDTPNSSWKRAYALIREGADLLLRRRAMSRTAAENVFEVLQRGKNETIPQGVSLDYPVLRAALGDYTTTFYGPHACQNCGGLIIKAAMESGGVAYDADVLEAEQPHVHACTPEPASSFH